MAQYSYPNNKTDLGQAHTKLEFIMEYGSLVFSL